MNDFGRKTVKALLLGGAIVTGFALNSTDSMAAEADAVNDDYQAADVNAEERNMAEETIQSMEDAVEVIEGDAVAEQGYLNQAQEATDNDSMTPEIAEDVESGGAAVMEQAQSKKDTVDAIYEIVNTETEAVKDNFIDAAEEYDLADKAKTVDEAQTNQQKIDIVNETASEAAQKHEDFVNNHGLDSKEHQDVVDEITDWEDVVAEAKTEYEKVSGYYDELEAKYQDVAERYNNYVAGNEAYKSEIDKLNAEIETANQELQTLHDDIVTKGTNYAEAIASLNEVFEDLKQSEKKLEEAASGLKEMSETESIEDYSSDTSDYDSELSNYNQVSQLLNTRSETVATTKNEYKTASDAYSAQNTIVSEKEKQRTELQTKYDQWLAENTSDVIDEYNNTSQELTDTIAKKETAERKYNLRNGYLEYLNNKKTELETNIRLEADKYSTVVDAVNIYLYALKCNEAANVLVGRAEAGLTKTSGYYEELKGIVAGYKAENDIPTFGEKNDAIAIAKNEIDEIVTIEEAYVAKAVEASSSETLILSEAVAINDGAKAKLSEATSKNVDARINYLQMKDEVEKVVQKYNELENLSPETSDYEYQPQQSILEAAKEVLDKADEGLQKVANAYNNVAAALSDYFADVTPYEGTYEYTEGEGEEEMTLRVAFVGNIKGDKKYLDMGLSIPELFNNMRAIYGDFTIDMYDKNGNMLGTVVRRMDFEISESGEVIVYET
ncbi:hypothetical protein SAMN02910298_02363 [Pseudobutyrivibrio sp. YE44]|uniref:hypothetical protein n=1 Tax=Pseudobutyrivibrio sp. YE44 TaxID=1520802 RepID=UPI0008828C28|nr:hypothetical protein [Pseudobutyrivibrio sp. YE44]SDB46984.1 hypothetical protein SAMN02910298_02363 [Pseudobutyrivibrio sp. YE44]